jgi:predicted protein tyrosine phosphatase
MKKRVLFVCEGNLHRSPTAAALYAATPGMKTRSAGTSSQARTQVTEELLAWADVIVVMERRLVRQLQRLHREELAGKELHCIELPDDYQFMQPELLAVLEERLTPLLGPPREPDEESPESE